MEQSENIESLKEKTERFVEEEEKTNHSSADEDSFSETPADELQLIDERSELLESIELKLLRQIDKALEGDNPNFQLLNHFVGIYDILILEESYKED